jgi:hypothetical protein
MTEHSIGKFYEIAQLNLIRWIEDNPKLKDKITPHDLKYLFEFHNRRGLSIDLCRFDLNYYNEVFFPPEDKKAMIDEFVRKVCHIIMHTLTAMGKEKVIVSVTVRHKVSRISHWNTFYLDKDYNPNKTTQLSQKQNDWL